MHHSEFSIHGVQRRTLFQQPENPWIPLFGNRLPAPWDNRGLRAPTIYITSISRALPDIWKEVDRMRSWRGKDLPTWPDWCFLPLAGAHTLITAAKGDDTPISEIWAFEAVAAWRATQGVYHFDQTIFDALWETPISGDIPGEVLRHLPEWSCYVECDRNIAGHPCYGFFVHLDYDIDARRSELHLLLDNKDDHLTPVLIYLTGTVEEGVEAALQDFDRRTLTLADTPAAGSGSWDVIAHLKAHRTDLEGMISVALYLASANAEIGSQSGKSPAKPTVTATKSGPRIFPPDRPRVWDVAIRLGAALRRAQEAAAKTGESKEPNPVGTHASPRPHIRRAHWHTFLAGPRDGEQERRSKWLPPIPVNVTDDAPLIPAIRDVE